MYLFWTSFWWEIFHFVIMCMHWPGHHPSGAVAVKHSADRDTSKLCDSAHVLCCKNRSGSHVSWSSTTRRAGSGAFNTMTESHALQYFLYSSFLVLYLVPSSCVALPTRCWPELLAPAQRSCLTPPVPAWSSSLGSPSGGSLHTVSSCNMCGSCSWSYTWHAVRQNGIIFTIYICVEHCISWCRYLCYSMLSLPVCRVKVHRGGRSYCHNVQSLWGGCALPVRHSCTWQRPSADDVGRTWKMTKNSLLITASNAVAMTTLVYTILDNSSMVSKVFLRGDTAGE